MINTYREKHVLAIQKVEIPEIQSLMQCFTSCICLNILKIQCWHISYLFITRNPTNRISLYL